MESLNQKYLFDWNALKNNGYGCCGAFFRFAGGFFGIFLDLFFLCVRYFSSFFFFLILQNTENQHLEVTLILREATVRINFFYI